MGVERTATEIVKYYSGRPIRVMEVCGTHTHAIFEHGIRNILPENIHLISGPGCPVCVTETGFIDEAVWLALERKATVTTFGDLVRVPGTEMSLAGARAKGGKIRIVYSPLDAVSYAVDHPNEDVVFLSVGFETTVPAACLAVKRAKDSGITNFSLLTANKTMDLAYRVLKGSADAFLYPGHVSAITGMGVYEELKAEGISGVVCGFTADEIMTALAIIVTKIESGVAFVVNAYPRVVTEEGMPAGRKLMAEIMEPCEAVWRGIGAIEGSGLKLRQEYADYDARIVHSIPEVQGRPNSACRCGDVLMGRIKPYECPLFGKVCTTEHPVGACMVSSEGTCSAYYKYNI
ncbi:MAG: hydrogenase formation protein HypD [Lachnospiraceae bacterium]|nr:hydrogenase formation protein HypD [Lachnospiraceae bacterium]